MSDSDSPLSSVPSDDESLDGFQFSGSAQGPVENGSASAESSSERETTRPRKRDPSPPHEYVLADNPDIAFIVMFRSRFFEAFPRSLPTFGPQDLERGIVDSIPSEQTENLLCALLGLVLNRKKFVERGHHQRALEEALQTYRSQWPLVWAGVNPLSGSRTFSDMSPTERLTLLRALVLWALSSSDAIQAILKDAYKQSRREDDMNQPLSVQPWGQDAYKRRYWLIEGRDDTYFRLYRENKALKNHTWWSVAGSIEELKSVADKLREDGGQGARRLSDKIMASIPRFEASEEKRKRRDYRIARREQFKRPEPGFSLYEGRTRGKRVKYTYSDGEESSDDASTRRSTRQSGVSTPGEPSGPTVTASGRQVKPRFVGEYGESALSGQNNSMPTAGDAGMGTDNDEPATSGRARRAAQRQNGWAKGRDHIEDYNSVDEMDDEEDAASSGAEWDGDEDADDDHMDEDDADVEDDDELSDEDENMDNSRESPSLIVNLRYGKKTERSSPAVNGMKENMKPMNPACNGTDSSSHILPKEDAKPAMKLESEFAPPLMKQEYPVNVPQAAEVPSKPQTSSMESLETERNRPSALPAAIFANSSSV